MSLLWVFRRMFLRQLADLVRLYLYLYLYLQACIDLNRSIFAWCFHLCLHLYQC